jgi:hypothetical protein
MKVAFKKAAAEAREFYCRNISVAYIAFGSRGFITRKAIFPSAIIDCCMLSTSPGRTATHFKIICLLINNVSIFV